MYIKEIFLKMERGKYFSSLLYSIFEGLNSLILSDYMSQNMSIVSFSIKNSLDTQTRFWVDGEWIDLKFTFYSKIFWSF